MMKMIFLALSLLAFAFPAAAAGLTSAAQGGNELLVSLVRMLNLVGLMFGVWWVIESTMLWKRSARNEQQHVSFKAVAVPMIAGLILACFTGFVALTSDTFGLRGIW